MACHIGPRTILIQYEKLKDLGGLFDTSRTKVILKLKLRDVFGYFADRKRASTDEAWSPSIWPELDPSLSNLAQLFQNPSKAEACSSVYESEHRETEFRDTELRQKATRRETSLTGTKSPDWYQSSLPLPCIQNRHPSCGRPHPTSLFVTRHLPCSAGACY